ncbi:MAG: hypothetical protein WCK05_10415, partial [Planctomycetota bacterium]
MQGRGLVRFKAGHRGLSGMIVIAPESLGTDALVLVGKAYKGPTPNTRDLYEAELVWDAGQAMVWAETLRPVTVEKSLVPVAVPGGFSRLEEQYSVKGFAPHYTLQSYYRDNGGSMSDFLAESRSRKECERCVKALEKALNEQAASSPLPSFGGDAIVTELSLPGVGDFVVAYTMHTSGMVFAAAQNKVGGTLFSRLTKAGIKG